MTGQVESSLRVVMECGDALVGGAVDGAGA